MTLIRVLLGTVLLLLVTIPDGFAYDFETVRLEMVDCQPDGIINAWRATWNPKEFWIEQAMVFKAAVERWDLTGSEQECQSASSQADRASCIVNWQNQYDAARKCLAHANQLCRKNLGC